MNIIEVNNITYKQPSQTNLPTELAILIDRNYTHEYLNVFLKQHVSNIVGQEVEDLTYSVSACDVSDLELRSIN